MILGKLRIFEADFVHLLLIAIHEHENSAKWGAPGDSGFLVNRRSTGRPED
jgi:hypothetical protein